MRCLQAAILLILCLGLWAQETREVSGIVRNERGRPVAGAAVQMTNLTSHQVWWCNTKSDGTYHFSGVSHYDSYRLQAKLRSLSGNVRHLSQYDARPAAVINLSIDTNWWREHR